MEESNNLSEYARNLPNDPKYLDRFHYELSLINKHGYTNVFMLVKEILDLCDDLPHILRGSAGCSLVAYAMGISDIDPVQENLPFSRFLSDLRPDLPDFDIDFTPDGQDKVHSRVYRRWYGRAARISNHLHYGVKGARNAARRVYGLKRNDSIPPGLQEKIVLLTKQLVGKHYATSLHCGGLVITDKPIPNNLKIGPYQIMLDKAEVEGRDLIKIDLLSNRGLGQLTGISSRPLTDYPRVDELTLDLLCKGETVGVTQAESPAYMKMLRAIKPRSIDDVILVTALIRPAAASRGRKRAFFEAWDRDRTCTNLVYEDDVIYMIANLLGCCESEADAYRRAFAKGDHHKISEFTHLISGHPNKYQIIDDLLQFKEYSICKAHAISYGRMIWGLAYQKAHNPHKFWESTLNICKPMYRKWVHVEHAKNSGLTIRGRGNWLLKGDELVSQNGNSEKLFPENPYYVFAKYGYWTESVWPEHLTTYRNDDHIYFAGLIATSRIINRHGNYITLITIGVRNNSKLEFLDLILDERVSLRNYDVISGSGTIRHAYNSETITIDNYTLSGLTPHDFSMEDKHGSIK